MKTYEFDVVLRGISEITETQANALFDAGCDDSTPVSCDGIAWLHFDRESATLESAIRSAVTQVQATGLEVERITLTATAAASLAS